MQAQHSAAIHAKHAQQAREELQEVRRRAADNIRTSTVSTEQLRELEQLRGRLASTEGQTPEKSSADSGQDLQSRLRAAEAEVVHLRMTAQGHALELNHVDESRDMKARLAQLSADLDGLRLGKAEAGDGTLCNPP